LILSLTRAEATTSRAVATTKINKAIIRTETKTTERMAGTVEVLIEKVWAQKWANILLDLNEKIVTDITNLVLKILRGARLKTKW
jgi:hypothetical protein